MGTLNLLRDSRAQPRRALFAFLLYFFKFGFPCAVTAPWLTDAKGFLPPSSALLFLPSELVRPPLGIRGKAFSPSTCIDSRGGTRARRASAGAAAVSEAAQDTAPRYLFEGCTICAELSSTFITVWWCHACIALRRWDPKSGESHVCPSVVGQRDNVAATPPRRSLHPTSQPVPFPPPFTL